MSKYDIIAKNVFRPSRSKFIFLLADLVFYLLFITLLVSATAIMRNVVAGLETQTTQLMINPQELESAMQNWTGFLISIFALVGGSSLVFTLVYTVARGAMWRIVHNKPHKLNYYAKLFVLNITIFLTLLMLIITTTLLTKNAILPFLLAAITIFAHFLLSYHYAKTTNIRQTLRKILSKNTLKLWYLVIPYAVLTIVTFVINWNIYKIAFIDILTLQNIYYVLLAIVIYITRVITFESVNHEEKK